jgi:hypothetical protein
VESSSVADTILILRRALAVVRQFVIDFAHRKPQTGQDFSIIIVHVRFKERLFFAAQCKRLIEHQAEIVQIGSFTVGEYVAVMRIEMDEL